MPVKNTKVGDDTVIFHEELVNIYNSEIGCGCVVTNVVMFYRNYWNVGGFKGFLFLLPCFMLLWPIAAVDLWQEWKRYGKEW